MDDYEILRRTYAVFTVLPFISVAVSNIEDDPVDLYVGSWYDQIPELQKYDSFGFCNTGTCLREISVSSI